MKNYLIFVIGPTAIGKTRLGIELANYFNSSIVSCDSRQFYKEMSIGTAVPSKDELNQAKHYFIQNKSIHETFNVGDYEREVIPTLNQLFKETSTQIVVGGSGLYVDAILKGFDQFPEVSNDLKQEIEDAYSTHGIAYLQKELEKRDLIYFSKLQKENPQTLENPQRMKRFVGVCLSSEKPYSSFLNQPKALRNFTPIIVGLTAERQFIYDRINQRVDLMMQAGLLNEVKKLTPHQHLNALQTVGYKELFSYLNNEINLKVATELIKQNTRRFAKRQLTWFKKYDNALWFDCKQSPQEIIKHIEKQKD